MKLISQLLTIIFSFILLSCAINEDFTFNKDGSINYSYIIDGSELMKYKPKSNSSQNIDSTFSFASFLEQNKDSISKLPLDQQKKLLALKPLKAKMYLNDKEDKSFIQLTGDFKNVDSLNLALKAIPSFNSTSSEDNPSLPITQIKWNGKKLEKNSKNSAGDINDDAIAPFKEGVFTSIFNFTKKVKSVSNSSAKISSDGKTVIAEYNAEEYLLHPEKTNIIIELEN